MKHPDTLAELRLAFSRGEIDGVTYKAIRRALVAAIASGAVPPSPLTPFVPIVPTAAPRPTSEVPPEHLQTRVISPEPATGAKPNVPQAPLPHPRPQTQQVSDWSPPHPARRKVAVFAVAGVLGLVLLAAALWFKSPAPDESLQATTSPVDTSPATQASGASAEALLLEKFVSDDDWSSAAVDSAAHALTVLNSAERDSVAGRGLIERLRHAVSQRIDQERELARSGNADASAIASLVALGRGLTIEAQQIDSLLADASLATPAQPPDVVASALPTASDAHVAPTATTSPLPAPTVALGNEKAQLVTDIEKIEDGKRKPAKPAQDVVAPQIIETPPTIEKSLAGASPLPSHMPAAPEPSRAAAKPVVVAAAPTSVPPTLRAQAAPIGVKKAANPPASTAQRQDPTVAPKTSTVAVVNLTGPVAAPKTVRSKNASRVCSAVNVEKVWKAPTERTVSCQDTLADGAPGPAMVAIPAGAFRMGGNMSFERPIHDVTIGKPLAVGKYEVTAAEYARYATAVNQPATAASALPMVNVTWHDASNYATWLSQQTGARYRLPTESEWEYFARAGATTRYLTGDVTPDPLIVGGFEQAPPKAPKSARNDSVNKFFLRNTLGNVREWVQDAWRESYDGASNDGSAVNGSGLRVVRGGGFRDDALGLRLGGRLRQNEDEQNDATGFRLVRELGE